MSKQYETVIGLEVHVELATKTKIFCGCSTEFGAAPNTQVCPVCSGMPGSLPVLNKKVVENAISVGLATNCSITSHCKFDRKNYFYPDNPQGYQISQLYLPICRDGYVEIETEEGIKAIGIHEIHMEEDAGKLIHDDSSKDLGEGTVCGGQLLSDYSLVDYNRSGVPLIEIVSEPDMRSAKEVIDFLEKLRLIIQYLGASDCKLQEGSMRADVNLSVRKVGEKELGTRTEMKNLNSFKAIARAIEGEAKRQIDLLKAGEKVVQETRRWDDNAGCSYPMRSKEDAQDYRYFPEPDLVPIVIGEEWIEAIRQKQPELRDAKIARYKAEYDLPDYDVKILTNSKHMAELFEETAALCGKPKKVSNWLMTETMRLLKEQQMEPEDISFSPENLSKIIELVDSNAITGTIGKEVFELVFKENIDPQAYVEEKGLNTTNNADQLKKIVEKVIVENPRSVEDYRSGKGKAIGFLVGQTMKATGGKGNPSVINELLKEIL